MHLYFFPRFEDKPKKISKKILKKMPKRVSFGPDKPIVPERIQIPEPASRLDRQGVKSPSNPTTKVLDIHLLSTIKCFLTFAGCLYNTSLNNIPTILFRVQYYNGTTGFVNCAELIRGQPKSIKELFGLHAKVRDAKELVSDEDWSHMETKFGYSRARTMEFECLQRMRQNGFYTALPDESDLLSSTSSQSGLGRWGPGVGISLGVGLGVAVGVGLGLGVALGLGVGVGLGCGLGMGFGVGLGFGLAVLGSQVEK